ncbi:MAG TPA: SEC-C domain-containing protein [Longimicrobium sp.]|nr:SEC-C domain-containing protein [Longimicrobium sp.]
MKTSRNDPCPCGSGKKYKACCMPRDLARERVKALVGDEALEAAEAFAQSTIAAQAVWEAEVVALPLPVAGGAPSLMLITAAGLMVHGEMVPLPPVTAEERATTIAQAVVTAGRAAGRLPERLHVRDAEVAALLEARLRARGVEVAAAPLAELDEAVQGVLGQMMDSPAAARVATPDTWRETGAPHEAVAEFHQVAAEFYRLAPWTIAGLQNPLLLDGMEGAQWGASVMGEAGVAYGLALYSEPLDLLALLAGDGVPPELAAMGGYALTVDLDERRALTRQMLREITAGGWTIAGPRAYPRLFVMNTPGRQVTPEYLRQATVALRAIVAAARGRDPQAETGVRVSPFPFPGIGAWDEDDWDGHDWDGEDDRLDYFAFPDEAAPMCAEGPNAEPADALRAWERGDVREAVEEDRLVRLRAWLESHAPPDALEADVRNARIWAEGITFMGVPAGAVTEHDLRLFIYDHYPRKGESTPEAMRALPDSLRRIVRFLEEQEGIRYPFAAAVLEELDGVVDLSDTDGRLLHETLDALAYEVYDDLDDREMLHQRDADGGRVHWPDMMNGEVAMLDRELQRRWLLWYDEEVRAGTTGIGELGKILAGRQRTWETTTHPALGQTPAEVVLAYLQSEAFLGRKDWKQTVG